MTKQLTEIQERVRKNIKKFAPTQGQWGRKWAMPKNFSYCLKMVLDIIEYDVLGEVQKININNLKATFASAVAEDRNIKFNEVYNYLWERDDSTTFPEWARDDYRREQA